MWSWENSKAENQSAIEPSSTFLTPTHKSSNVLFHITGQPSPANLRGDPCLACKRRGPESSGRRGRGGRLRPLAKCNTEGARSRGGAGIWGDQHDQREH